ncbi:MAG: bifunctional riboflavin kinase/FAD synthetase [Spongiibacteraceae bacterium]|nr:bifunctional riboflavin kinase/FAD synthetase [Spongiibacteraceae bacterium]
MELIRGLHNLRPHHRGCVVTIGAFDGVHRGHQAVLRSLMAKGQELGLPSVVVVFEPLPREYFSPLDAPPRLMSFREKFVALAELGIDRLLRVRFDERLRRTSPRQFVEEVIAGGLGARFVLVGDDSRFGRDRGGDEELLRAGGERFGYSVAATSTVLEGSERISSTRIREALGAARFEEAERLLGRPYSITGRVVTGKQLGRQLGAPTANIQLRRIRAPLNGVYAVQVQGVEAGRCWPGVANIGVRPTVGDLVQAVLEVHLFDFSGDIYRRKLTVQFRHKLRDEIKFESLAALQAQIQCDFHEGRRLLGLNP